jgi:hypothetical protein
MKSRNKFTFPSLVVTGEAKIKTSEKVLEILICLLGKLDARVCVCLLLNKEMGFDPILGVYMSI